METTLSLNTKKVVIGPNHPFVVIGERINPTRRKKLAATMAEGDFSEVLEDAREYSMRWIKAFRAREKAKAE